MTVSTIYFLYWVVYHCCKIIYRLFPTIGLWEHLQETPIFNGKNHGFPLDFLHKQNL